MKKPNGKRDLRKYPQLQYFVEPWRFDKIFCHSLSSEKKPKQKHI